MRNYALSLMLPDGADVDALIDDFDAYLTSHQIGETYAADPVGDRFDICFCLEDDDEQKLGEVAGFIDRLPPGWSPTIERIQ